MPTRNGKSVPSWYHTAKAKEWSRRGRRHAAGRKLRAATYTVSYAVFTGSAVCTDVDNYAKCVLDGLAHCGVIDNDKNVIDLHGYRRIDRGNPTDHHHHSDQDKRSCFSERLLFGLGTKGCVGKHWGKRCFACNNENRPEGQNPKCGLPSVGGIRRKGLK